MGRQHRTFTETTDNWGRERPAQCGDAAGWAIAEPASGPAQTVTKGNQASKGRWASLSELAETVWRWWIPARCSPLRSRKPLATAVWGRRAQWRSAGGTGGDGTRPEPRSQSAGACGGSLAAPNPGTT